MRGGVILFRGTGAAARRYLESDRSRADDYYLEDVATLAAFTVTGGAGEVRKSAQLDAQAYAGWVDWVDPLTGASMGKPVCRARRARPSMGRRGLRRWS